MHEERYTLSPEEIGILLSFARRPEVVTREWIRRLRIGVPADELRQLFAAAGLPASTASEIIATAAAPETLGGSPRADNAPFKRALLGTAIVYTALAASFVVARDGFSINVLVLISAFVACGVIVHSTVRWLGNYPG